MTTRSPAPGDGPHDVGDAPIHRVDPRGAVVAVSAEDDRYRPVRERAAEIARAEGRGLILYDLDAPSLFAAPLPTFWSGDGPGERPHGPLDEHDLITAGRTKIADQVHSLRASGLPAAGWLPADAGGGALRAYAEEQGAAVVVVPAGLDGLDALTAVSEPSAAADAAASRAVALRVIEVED